jgi:hypothetical protein
MPSLTALSAQQAGCFSRTQAIVAGLTDDAIEANVRAGRWRSVHPGVLVGFTGPLPYVSRVWAGLLAAGPGAAVTRTTALRLFGLHSAAEDERLFIVIDHARRVVAPNGTHVRRRRGLATVVHPQRTPPTVRVEEAVLQHVARSTRLAHGLGLISDACQQGLTTPMKLHAALVSLPRLRRRRTWFAVLDDVSTGAHSFLELTYLRRVERAHGLPTPQRQVAGGSEGGRVWRDGHYSEYGVIHELDGRLGHEWAGDQLRDRRRDARAAAAGAITLRHCYADVLEPCDTARLMGAALRARGWRGQLKRCGSACTALG